MWEYRLIWTAGAPPWWDAAWKMGEAVLQRQKRKPEDRPDTYLVLNGRTDVGLKLRGGAEEQFDAKVLHRRERGWELWEKITFFRWDDLEAARLAAMLQRALPLETAGARATPAAGVKALLRAAGIASRELKVDKRRLQTRSAELMPAMRDAAPDPSSLVELVEIRGPGAVSPALSVCFEAMTPLAGDVDPLPPNGAVCCGYPEFLARHCKTVD